MKHARKLTGAALLGALLAILTAAPAFGAVTVLTTATATTSTADTGVITAGRRYARAAVYNTAGTATVLVEEQSDAAGTFPWILMKTMTNCDANGIDGSSAPCVYATTTPAVRLRLRVSACAGCSVKRVIQDVP